LPPGILVAEPPFVVVEVACRQILVVRLRAPVQFLQTRRLDSVQPVLPGDLVDHVVAVSRSVGRRAQLDERVFGEAFGEAGHCRLAVSAYSKEMPQ
jgi:hypothetical protein